MEFKNDHPSRQREARLQVALPPGGAVSRLTLWVNGEEREAAFAGRAQVREAYQKVAIQQRRDPVLVTTSGPDRVLVQCFPIQPGGGTMKIRLGITAPFVIEKENQVALKLPAILERNFGLKQTLEHSFWLEAPHEPSSGLSRLVVDRSKPGRHGLRGQFPDSELNTEGAVLRFPIPSTQLSIRARHHQKNDGLVIAQTIESVSPKLPGRIAIVLDGSKDMTEFFPQIARALDGLPAQPELAVWFVQDGVRQIFNREWQSGRPVSEAVGSLHGTGGQDDVAALLQAWEWAAAKPESTILWFHGPQPELIEGIETLKQRLEWSAGTTGPTILDVPVRSGVNRITESLGTMDGFTALTRLGALKTDLERLFGWWSGRQAQWKWVRTVEQKDQSPEGKTPVKSASHLIRLWAQDEIKALAKSRRVAEAVKLAGLYQLVTLVSGAVVLETAQQFEQAGLTPADPATVPAVPEPSTWALLLVGICVVLFYRRRTAK